MPKNMAQQTETFDWFIMLSVFGEMALSISPGV
jgi:hypothetical protein